VPLADLSRTFKEAGLHFLGQTYLGAKDTENFIKEIAGLDEETRDAVLSIHRSGMIPDQQSGYLMAALGRYRLKIAKFPVVGRTRRQTPIGNKRHDSRVIRRIGRTDQLRNSTAEIGNKPCGAGRTSQGIERVSGRRRGTIAIAAD